MNTESKMTRQRVGQESVESQRRDTMTADDAKAAVARINDGSQQMSDRAYQLGALLNEARCSKAHTALGYDSWDAFVDEEIHLTRSTTYRFAAIASAFTRDEFRTLGSSKAEILVRLPAEKRAALLSEARTLSVRKLTARIALDDDAALPRDTTESIASTSLIVRIAEKAQTVALALIPGDRFLAVGVLRGLRGETIQLTVIGEPNSHANGETDLSVHLKVTGGDA